MKINGNHEIIKSAYPDKSRKNEQTQDADFKNILKASIEKSTDHKTEVQSSTLMNPMTAIRFNPISPEDKRAMVERVDNLLNLLDNYRKQLTDPKVTLRSIEPVMNTIETEKDQLSAVLDSLPNEDGLKDILNRTLITASLEIVKYNRGDYISN